MAKARGTRHPEVERQRYFDRVKTRMEKVDAMSPEVRAVVHDWGLGIVQTFLDCGVKDPRHMRHIILRILEDTRGSQGPHHAGSKQRGPRFDDVAQSIQQSGQVP